MMKTQIHDIKQLNLFFFLYIIPLFYHFYLYHSMYGFDILVIHERFLFLYLYFYLAVSFILAGIDYARTIGADFGE